MMYGFFGVKEQYLDCYVEVFVVVGFVVFFYDYLNFGDSDGELCQEIDLVMQCCGYCDVIIWLGVQVWVDVRCIGIWGISYSGGYVLEVVVLDWWVKCVVVQVLIVSGYVLVLCWICVEQLLVLLVSFDVDCQWCFEGLLLVLLLVVVVSFDEFCVMVGVDVYWFFIDSVVLVLNWCNWVILCSVELV